MDNVILMARDLQQKSISNSESSQQLLTQIFVLQENLQIIGEYQDCVDNINQASGRDYTSIYSNKNLNPKDKSQFAQLQKENMDLRTTLDDYQTALELVMSKYRQHMGKLIESQKTDAYSSQLQQTEKDMQKKNDQISHMLTVMNQAVKADDKLSIERDEEIVSLKSENEGLKMMLGIAENGAFDYEMIKNSRENTIYKIPKKSESLPDFKAAKLHPINTLTKLAIHDSMEDLNVATVDTMDAESTLLSEEFDSYSSGHTTPIQTDI